MFLQNESGKEVKAELGLWESLAHGCSVQPWRWYHIGMRLDRSPGLALGCSGPLRDLGQHVDLTVILSRRGQQQLMSKKANSHTWWSQTTYPWQAAVSHNLAWLKRGRFQGWKINPLDGSLPSGEGERVHWVDIKIKMQVSCGSPGRKGKAPEINLHVWAMPRLH